MARIVIGVLLIASIFVGMGIFIYATTGLKGFVTIVGGTALVALIIVSAVYLLVTGSEQVRLSQPGQF